MKTYNKAKFFVVSRVHGLALLNAAAVVGLALNIKSNPAQLEDDVPLSLHKHRYETILLHSSHKSNQYVMSICLFGKQLYTVISRAERCLTTSVKTVQ